MLRDPKPIIEQVTNKILSMPNPTMFFARFSTMDKTSKTLGQLSFVEVDASGMLIPKHIICIQLPTDKCAVVILGGSLSEEERLEVFELFNKEGWIDSTTLPQGARPLPKRSSKPAVDESAGDIKTQKEKSEEPKTKENQAKIFETLMDAICCVMCADRKVTTGERKAIHTILEKTKAPWKLDEINNRIDVFIQRVKKNGLKRVIQETCQKLPEFKKRKKEHVLLQCIDYMARADGIIDEDEKKLCQKFRSVLEVKKDTLANSSKEREDIEEQTDVAHPAEPKTAHPVEATVRQDTSAGSAATIPVQKGKQNDDDIASTIAAPAEKDVAEIHREEQEVPVEWEKGQTILDLYEVKHVHRTGGMGLVYKVHHKNWNTDLAVKSPKADFFKTEAQKENFIRECETWINLGLHPNIVSCYYVRTLGGIPRVFAEYVEGGSLKDWIDNIKLYEGGKEKVLERILDIAIQFAWGLLYAHEHEQGLVHQDVKPANVMMTEDGSVKVTDFGLAKARAASSEAVDTGTQQSILVSSGGMTPAYCSPEQANKEQFSRRTDIWSWGLSVMEMFAGKVFWRAGQAAPEALDSFLEMGAEDEGIPKMPEKLAELLKQCFQHNPDDRPKDMTEIAERLKQINKENVGQEYTRPEPKPAELLADGLNNRAASMLDLGKPEAAVSLWENALVANKHHLESTYNLSLIRWRSGQTTDETVVQQLRELCASNPHEWLPRYLLGLVHLERGCSSEALEIFSDLDVAGEDGNEIRRTVRLAEDQLPTATRLVRSYRGHAQDVNTVGLALSQCRIFSGESSDKFLIWNLDSGECSHRTDLPEVFWKQPKVLNPHTGQITSGMKGNIVALFDLATGQTVRTFEGHSGEICSLGMSQNGYYLLSGGSDGTLRLWESASGKCLRIIEGHADKVTSVAMSEDGQLVISGSLDGTLRLWNTASGECLRTFTRHALKLYSISVSKDWHVAVSSGGDGHSAAEIKVWDILSGNCLRDLKGHSGRWAKVKVTADGNFAVSGDQECLRLWDLSSGRCICTLAAEDFNVLSIDLSSDGLYALTGGGSYYHLVKLWRLSWAPPKMPLRLCRIVPGEQADAINRVFCSAMHKAGEAAHRSDYITVAKNIRIAREQAGFNLNGDAIRDWGKLYIRLARRSLLAAWEEVTLEGRPPIALSYDGKFGISGAAENTLKLWETSTGKSVRVFGDSSSRAYSVCISNDGRYAVSGGKKGQVDLWDVAEGRHIRSYAGHESFVNAVTFSPMNKVIVSAGRDKTLRVWDLATGHCLRKIEHPNSIYSMVLSPDGQYAFVGSYDFEAGRLQDTFNVWDIARGQCLRRFKGHTEHVNSVSISAGGRYVLSGSKDGTIKLWEAYSGRCLCSITVQEQVAKVSLSTEGRYALSATEFTNTFQMWDLSTGQCLRTFEGHERTAAAICFSRDCRYVLSSDGKTLKLWFLDWDLDENQPADWDEGARPYLQSFLAMHTPYGLTLPRDRNPSDEEIILALTRQGKPAWTNEDLGELSYLLGCAGYGWLRVEGIRKKLEEMTTSWQGPTPFMADSPEHHARIFVPRPVIKPVQRPAPRGRPKKGGPQLPSEDFDPFC